MTDQKQTSPNGVAELSEEDLKKLQGGDFSVGFRPTKVEVESVSTSGARSFKSEKT